MDYFDKKIKEIYNQPEQEVPSEFSWDFMEDGIYERMEDKKSGRKGFWLWFSGGLFVMIFIASIIHLTTDNEKFSTVDLADYNNQTKTNNKAEEINLIENYKPVQPIKIVTESKPTIININGTTSTTSTKNKIAVETSSSKSNVPFETYNQIKNQVIENASDNTILALNTQKPTTSSHSNSYNKEKKEVHNKEAVNLLTFQSIASTLPISIIYQRTAIKNQNNITIQNSSTNNNVKSSTKYRLSVLGGITLNSGYKIITDERQYHSTLPGYNIRVGIEAQKENGWGYQFGIGHSLLVEKFDLDLVDTISEIRNVIVQSITNTVSGNVTHNHADVNQLSIRDRRELSYNTINTLSLDASIFRSIELGNKWSVAPNVGVQYSRILDIKGKDLNEAGNIISFDNKTNSVNKNMISGQLGLRLNYQLSKRFGISADMNKTLSVNTLTSDGYRLGILYIRGGLTYTW